jgi:hypothetical protein
MDVTSLGPDITQPPVPTIPTDPALAAQQQQAQTDLVKALQTQTQGDMASLMARYGTQLAIGGAGPRSNAGPLK